MFNTSTQVLFSDDQPNNRTVMELTTGDKPGLLAETGTTLLKQNIFIRMAKIVTVGERAEDVFYITDNKEQMLNETQQNNLREALISAIDKGL